MRNDSKRILIVGKHSYIAQSFKKYIQDCYRDENWKVDLVGAISGEWESYDFNGYDVIIHAAAIVHQKESVMGETLYRTINYEMPLKVACKAKAAGVSQFVFLSTMAVYGNVSGKITEDTRTNPSTYYGKYKLLAEEALWNQSSDSFKIAVIRPPMVYGKGCKGNFERLMKLSRLCFVFPKIENKRSMIYIDNLCEYIHLIILQRESGVGCPQNEKWVETSDLFYQMRMLQSKRTIIIRHGNSILQFLEKRVTSFQKLFGNCYYDIERIENGWISIAVEEYQEVSYKESIKKCL